MRSHRHPDCDAAVSNECVDGQRLRGDRQSVPGIACVALILFHDIRSVGDAPVPHHRAGAARR